jgi:CRP/FNR family transcriptional regulator, cyclic AMP receptor protein
MKKILLIEDNETVRNNTAEILELSNYKVETAENGKTGIAKAIAFKPDLIICDIMMPELDGYGVLHALHKNDAIKSTPFIFLTAKTESSDFRKGMELGADDYIVKPFSGTDLLNAVDSRIKKHDLLKEDLAPAAVNSGYPADTPGENSILAFLIQGRNSNRYKRKQVIYSEGNHPNALYYVVKGKIKAYKTNEEGKGLVTDLFNTGDFLGYITLLEGGTYNDTAVALEDTELAVIPRDDFIELMSSSREVRQKFIQLLAQMVIARENKMLGIAYSSLRKKVANALLLLQNKYSDAKEEKFTIDINRESLATIAGTATESLIRTLTDFKTEKLIDMSGNAITLLNCKKLEQLPN